MKKILYLDGCVNRASSRTERLAQAFLQKQQECMVETEILETADLAILDAERLKQREAFRVPLLIGFGWIFSRCTKRRCLEF